MAWVFRIFFLIFVVGGVWLMHRHIAGRPAPRLESVAGYEGENADIVTAARRVGRASVRKTSAAIHAPKLEVRSKGLALESKASGDDSLKAGDKGFSYAAFAGVLREAASDPKGLRGILDNEYLVESYLSLSGVRAAMSSKSALAAYLRDPKNLSRWMANRGVQAVYGDDRAFDAVASSRLVAEMLEHPSVIALLSDRSATADIMASNPPLAAFFSDPRVVGALMRNPKTAAAMAR